MTTGLVSSSTLAATVLIEKVHATGNRAGTGRVKTLLAAAHDSPMLRSDEHRRCRHRLVGSVRTVATAQRRCITLLVEAIPPERSGSPRAWDVVLWH